jgi:hypothetical protein
MECDFNLLCYGLLKSQKLFKSLFKPLKKIIYTKKKLWFFNMSYNIMFWNWKWKKKSISSKYLYFKPIFNYIRKGLWKGTLICQNCDTLMCFHPYNQGLQ